MRGRQPDGGFAEAGGQAGPALTAWAAVGLVAAGQDPGAALDYLRAHEQEVTSPVTRTLIAFAEAALGDPDLAAALPLAPTQTNTIAWTILARRQAGLSVPKQLVTTLLVRQAKNGGWGWGKGVAPDSNDTAAAVEALRAAGVSGKPIRRALAYLATLRRPDGGFALGSTGASDAQSTAWAIQAYLAAGKPVAEGRARVPRAHAAGRRELPVLAALRRDARVGDRAGPACGGEEAVPVPTRVIERGTGLTRPPCRSVLPIS